MPEVTAISTISSEEAAVVQRLHTAWVFGWDKDPGQSRWDFRAVHGEHYKWTFDDAHFYDDMDPQHRVFRNVRDYQAAWEPTFNELREASHRIEDGPQILGTPALALSRLVFIARLVTADNSVIDIRSHNSLTWFKFPAGWKIVGDHTSSQRLAPDDPARLLPV